MKTLAAMLMAAGILLFPQAAVNGGQAAMQSWAHSVAPAVFPFLALMPCLTSPEACAAYERWFGKIMEKVFALPGSAAAAVCIGMISGSPGGAAALRSIAAQTLMPPQHSKRIALAVCGFSPSYLVLGVGQGLYGSAALGFRLAAIQAGVQLLLLFLLKPVCTGMSGAIPPPDPRESSRPIRNAVETTIVICGYMVFFSAIASVLAAAIGKNVGKFTLLLLDAPSGIGQISTISGSTGCFLLGLGIGFGGICIAAQNLDVLRSIGMRPREYISVRCFAASITAFAASMLLSGGKTGANAHPAKEIYACSLLFSLVSALPGLILFSKNIFLNNRKLKKRANETA